MSEKIVQLNGETVLCKVGGISMSMWMESTRTATGAESLKM